MAYTVYTVLAYTVMANTVMVYVCMANTVMVYVVRGLYGYGLGSYGPYTHCLCRYGPT